MDTLQTDSSQEEHTHHITDIRFRPNSSQLLTSSLDRTVRLWNAADVCFTFLACFTSLPLSACLSFPPLLFHALYFSPFLLFSAHPLHFSLLSSFFLSLSLSVCLSACPSVLFISLSVSLSVNYKIRNFYLCCFIDCLNFWLFGYSPGDYFDCCF